MALLEGYKDNFDALRRAFRNGDAALMECQSVATGEIVPVICAVNHQADGSFAFVPFAAMLPGNPYEAVNPPNPDGGFRSQGEVHG